MDAIKFSAECRTASWIVPCASAASGRVSSVVAGFSSDGAWILSPVTGERSALLARISVILIGFVSRICSFHHKHVRRKLALSTLYIISYDLRKPSQDYPTLINALKRKGAKRILKSQWALKTNTSGQSAELRDELLRLIDDNDRILVTQLNGWAWFNLMADLNRL